MSFHKNRHRADLKKSRSGNSHVPPHRLLALIILCLATTILLGSDFKAEQTLSVPGGTLPEAVSQAASGIVRVQAQCLEGENVLEEHLQTGFLVGTKGTEPYVVTAASGLSFDKDKIRKDHQLEENVQLTERVAVIFQGDTSLEASCLDSSAQKNLALLKLSASLTDRYILCFSEDSVQEDMHLWLLCFPLRMEEDRGKANYSARTVQILEGIMKGRLRDADNGTRYLEHTAEEDEGAYGAPLLDDHGWVTGMNVPVGNGQTAALSAAELSAFIELHNLPYTSASKDAPVKHSLWIYILGAASAAALVFMGTQIHGYFRTRRSVNTKPGGGLQATGKGRLLDLERREEIRIGKDRFVLGASKDKSDYLIEGNRRVSRAHAAITYSKSGYSITDLHSTNGTKVNGQRLEPDRGYLLSDGDLIEIADVRFAFRS